MSTSKISVVVPAHNDAAVLARCLRAVAESDYRDYECIVVDDGSTDDITHVATQFGTRVIRVADGPRGPAHARNVGAGVAKGEILVFLDADVVIAPHTLRQFAETFESHPGVGAVFGSYDDSPATPDFVSQYKNLSHHFVHQQASEEAGTFWSGCGGIRSEVFRSAGGFDASRYRRPCIEDIELGYRLRASGHRILLNKSIQVKHLKRWTLRSMMKSDVFDRGIPWTLLILEHKHLPNDLNLHLTQRLSAILACAMLLYVAVVAVFHNALTMPLIVAPPLVAALLIVVLNHRLYAFFAERRGVTFAIAALPMHLLYYSCTLLALTLGVVAFLTGRLAHREQARAA